MRWALRIAIAVFVVLAGIIGVLVYVSRPAEPGHFYATPSELPTKPGAVIRSKGFDQGVPAGAEAHLIMYTTTIATGEQRVATATVLVPKARPKGNGAHPVLAWAHGTTGIVPGCAPSLLSEPWGGIPALGAVLKAGYVVVATDYVGLGTKGPHEYLVGDTAARNVLDSIRALHAYDAADDVTHGVGLTDETVVWGHSQGGQTTLFTGQIAKEYAPDVDIVGLGALSPPAHLSALLVAEKDSTVGKVLSSLAIESWSHVYHDIDFDDIVRPAARPVARRIAGRCLTEPAAFLTILEGLSLRGSILKVDPATYRPLVRRMEQNSAKGEIPFPLFIGQGAADEVVAPKVTETYVDELCRKGQDLDFHLLPGIGHLGIVEEGSPIDAPLLAWTADRFAGERVPAGCHRHDG
ncbi:lipase family protein [Aquihabitans sp. McL0605]|uniref:lipase family protein n=1 Tax=Aquihabitans sp. McL0605 TaxID=3415671 RepID=UPI003CF9F612